MPPLSDPERLQCYRNALANWRFEGYVRFTELADRWVRKELGGGTTRDIARLMNDFANGSPPGVIDEQRETRPEWSEHEYHYDLRFEIAGRRLYIETRLFYDDPDDTDDPIIYVVNIHDA